MRTRGSRFGAGPLSEERKKGAEGGTRRGEKKGKNEKFGKIKLQAESWSIARRQGGYCIIPPSPLTRQMRGLCIHVFFGRWAWEGMGRRARTGSFHGMDWEVGGGGEGIPKMSRSGDRLHAWTGIPSPHVDFPYLPVLNTTCLLVQSPIHCAPPHRLSWACRALGGRESTAPLNKATKRCGRASEQSHEAIRFKPSCFLFAGLVRRPFISLLPRFTVLDIFPGTQLLRLCSFARVTHPRLFHMSRSPRGQHSTSGPPDTDEASNIHCAAAEQ